MVLGFVITVEKQLLSVVVLVAVGGFLLYFVFPGAPSFTAENPEGMKRHQVHSVLPLKPYQDLRSVLGHRIYYEWGSGAFVTCAKESSKNSLINQDLTA